MSKNLNWDRVSLLVWVSQYQIMLNGRIVPTTHTQYHDWLNLLCIEKEGQCVWRLARNLFKSFKVEFDTFFETDILKAMIRSWASLLVVVKKKEVVFSYIDL